MWNHNIRNWLYPLTVAIAVICVGWSLVHYKTNAHSYEECARAAEIAALNDFEFNSTIDPEYKPQKSEKNQQNISNQVSCSDLSAQWAMSDIAMMGYIAGLAGLLFLIITIFETKSAADLTRQALADTKSNSKRELRAYVHVVPYAINLNATDRCPTIHFRVFNRGQTPAINISCEVTLEVEDGIAENVETDFHCKISIPPNSHEDIKWPLEGQDADTPWTLNIAFTTKYEDIFAGKRFVEIGFNVSDTTFPDQRALKFETNYISRENGLGGTNSDRQTIPYVNPDYTAETPIEYIAYRDDLQKEAEEYGQTNKPA